MAKKTKSSFQGRIGKSAEKRKRGVSYGYLNVPKEIDILNVKPDTTLTFDIMPYTVTDKNHPDAPIAEVGELWYKRPFKIHRNIGVGDDNVVCPTSFGKNCPICDYRKQLQENNGNDSEIKALRASDRNLYAVILKGRDVSDKVHLLDFSDFLFQEKFEEQLGDLEPDKFEVFPDHTMGYSLRVRFAGNAIAGGKSFPDPARFDFVERTEQYDDSVLDEIPNLDKCLDVLSYEDLKNKFFEIYEEDDEGEEKEKKDYERPTKRTKYQKPVKEEDESNDDDDDYEDDSPFDDEPATRTTRRIKYQETTEEDDPNDDDDDAPAIRTTRKRFKR